MVNKIIITHEKGKIKTKDSLDIKIEIVCADGKPPKGAEVMLILSEVMVMVSNQILGK